MGGKIVSVGVVVGVSVNTAMVFVDIGAKSLGICVGEGKGVGVFGKEEEVSASESAIPPITNKSETMAMMSPPPI